MKLNCNLAALLFKGQALTVENMAPVLVEVATPHRAGEQRLQQEQVRDLQWARL